MPELNSYQTLLEGVTDFINDGTYDKPALADTLFQRERIVSSYEVEVDKYTGTNEAAPFVKGSTVTPSSLNEIEHAVYTPKRIAASVPVSERDSFVVAPGANKYNSEALTADLIRMSELNSILNRRLNMMAVHTLSTGKVLDQDGEVVFDFKKNTAKLSKANVGFSGNNNPFTALDDLFTVMVQEFNSVPTGVVLIMGVTAYSKFIANTIVQKAINSRANIALNKVGLGENTATGLHYPATIPINVGMINGEVPIVTYTGSYNDADGNLQPVMPKDSVILTTRDALANNTRVFCAQRIKQVNGEYSKVVGKLAPAFEGSTFDMTHMLVSRPMFIPRNVNEAGHLTIA